MITASQLHAARALAGITRDELAAASGLSVDAIDRAETATVHGEPGVTERLRVILESKGIIFVAAGDGDPAAGIGVRLRQVSHDEGLRPQNLNSANDG
ncbi:XRE family transcriptional regulator [Rhizobium deserti]|uniref:XRE family transcriptional regulator n=1 Tax=Rhizobium deserti TaxID=2547961 RepID=A0A4R5UJH6_9HYPH|nr:helix-turn-helix domain-containing protein [Rhizobium deserti]TDK37018.1 XRE family transcriptional regulator [Rhizobium deserti]